MNKYKEVLPIGTEIPFLGITLKIVKYTDDEAVANYTDFTGQLREFILSKDHLEILYKERMPKYPPYLYRSTKHE